MLNKIAHILVALFFLGTATGMTLTKHYCGTALKSISVDSMPDNCCGAASKCCHNESFTIKIENDFSLITNNFDFSALAITLPNSIELLENEVVVTKSIINTNTEGPPPKIQRVLSKLQAYLL